jgi:hypothetical protein
MVEAPTENFEVQPVIFNDITANLVCHVKIMLKQGTGNNYYSRITRTRRV